jgi:hypothetical protein
VDEVEQAYFEKHKLEPWHDDWPYSKDVALSLTYLQIVDNWRSDELNCFI